MARYKDTDRSQIFFAEIDFSSQLVEGTMEHTIHYLIENKIDLTGFDKHFQNDRTGQKACQTNIVFMTLAIGKTPHFTYIADFIHRFEEEIKSSFLEVLLICWEMDLIGGEFLALDGCKLPSNAAKEWSGTFADFKSRLGKLSNGV